VSPEEAQQGDPLNGLSDAKRSRVDKLSVDYATKVIDLEIKPAGADFDMDAWVEWTDPDGKTDMRPCSFSGNALSELTRDFAPPEIEFGDNYVKGTITFDYSGVPNFEEARGTLSFYYSILPAP
ncbi:MAG: hypothetical protein KAI47_04720, partial [Deltaproteobacteria bacterium]|nr:hypothetical protein [Deltaproteobacteria bacterium]